MKTQNTYSINHRNERGLERKEEQEYLLTPPAQTNQQKSLQKYANQMKVAAAEASSSITSLKPIVSVHRCEKVWVEWISVSPPWN